ncbi:putative oxygenase MesX, partial [Acinetobacter baumannii]
MDAAGEDHGITDDRAAVCRRARGARDMSTDFTFQISTTRFDENYSPSESSRATTNF